MVRSIAARAVCSAQAREDNVSLTDQAVRQIQASRRGPHVENGFRAAIGVVPVPLQHQGSSAADLLPALRLLVSSCMVACHNRIGHSQVPAKLLAFALLVRVVASTPFVGVSTSRPPICIPYHVFLVFLRFTGLRSPSRSVTSTTLFSTNTHCHSLVFVRPDSHS